MKKSAFLIIIGSLFFFLPLCFCQEITPLPGISQKDKILIFAPHPDDETIGTAGLIQKALKAGAKVKVVCFTNGDHNELAFIVYEKRLTLRKGEFVHMGEVRRKETLAAMQYLGLSENDIIFLGYPDFGTLEILTKYWDKARPFKDFLTRISRVPYAECLSPNAPYVGESILKDIKTVLLDFKPTEIFISHPVDTNRDHRSLYLFLQVALWDLEGQIKRPEIFPYLIHVAGWPRPRGFHPELMLVPPEKLKASDIFWQEMELREEEIKAKKQAISLYKSQVEPYPPYLFSFARENELFSDYPVINLNKQNREEIQWQGLYGMNASNLAYAQKEKFLFIKLMFKHRINKNFGVSIYLLGYNKRRDFAVMPKIRLHIGIAGLQIKEKKQTLFVKAAQLTYQDNSLILKIPLSLLGGPEYLFASAKTNSKDLTFADTAWRIIKLE